jgi:hypothetical protein
MPGMKAAANTAPQVGRGVDMTVATPRANLDDPGVGLRDNGRRVLTYADMRTAADQPQVRSATSSCT